MLCDKLLGPWMDMDETVPDFVGEEYGSMMEDCIKTGVAPDKELMQKYLPKIQAKKKLIEFYLKKFHTHIHFSKRSIPLSYVPIFQDKLKHAQKFSLTDSFAMASLDKLMTPETLIKAKEWFKLIHNPMWIEWNVPEKLESYRMGVLFYCEDEKIMCYSVGGIFNSPENNVFCLDLCRIFPDSIRLDGDDYTFDMEDKDGIPLQKTDHHSYLAKWAYDFIIRLNSPRITHFNPPEDMSRINKKRAKLGRFPLCSYQIVDLTKELKEYIKGSISDHAVGMKFHWRRGHFKVCRTGIFWWNPHTAGRKQYGEVVKEYTA